jgi:hypothetical protein
LNDSTLHAAIASRIQAELEIVARNRKPTSQCEFWRWDRWRRWVMKCSSPAVSSRQNACARNRGRRDNRFWRSWRRRTS